MDTIKEVVKNVMQSWQDKKGGAARDHPETWLKKTFAKKDLAHIKIKYMRKGVLGLAVDSSSRLYKLNLDKKKILAKLKQQSPQIREMRFSIGEF